MSRSPRPPRDRCALTDVKRSRRVLASVIAVVVTAVAAVAMVYANPASAASVVITPISATGFVHAANDGSPEVDITVCASFDQPVRFIEALVRFSLPNLLGVAILGPTSGAVTNWCGTFADLNAGPQGATVGIDVSWSAHNGNGLSEGHAHSNGSYTVPGPPPPTPKKTPQQAADLGHASNAMWAATAIIAVGAAILTVAAAAATGGAALALAPAMIGLLGGGVAAYMAAELGDLAIDPPDPNYTVPVVPHNVALTPYVAGNGLTPAAADALNALRVVEEDETGQAAAMLAALYKAEGAAAANDAVWEQAQSLAAADFAHQLALDLNSEPPLRSAARSALEASGFGVFAITADQAAAQQAAWDSPGLTPAQMDALTLGGTYPGMDDRLHALAHTFSPTAFVQQNALDLLAPAPGQGQPNQLEAAYAEAAAALLTWSDALRANPVGSPPPSPAIITGIQPSEGVAAGGTSVTIFGSNLLDTTQVNFGATPATSGTCTPSQCTVVSPLGTGTVDVTAIGPGGTSAVTPADRFTYVTGVPGPIHLPADTLITSGGFDPPGSESVQSFDSLVGPTGAAKLGEGWQITAGSVDLVGPSSAQAAEGVQFVDLNGNDVAGPGTISQTIPTLPGHKYRLSFQLAGNPNGDPVIKTMTASIGTMTQDFTFDTTGHTNLNLGWVEKDVDALSCSSTLPVTLKTTTPGQRGPNIDAVSVVDLGLAPAGTCIAPVTETHTSITSDAPDPSLVGQAVTVHYSVTSAGGTPTGNVTVSDGTVSCTGTVSAGQCSLTLTSAGAKSLTATYAGDGNFTGSASAAEAHTVNRLATTTTITADSPDPSDVGQPVTVQYTVAANAPGAGTPTGNVTVSNGTVSCTGTLSAGQCSLTFTSAGAKSLTATYAGDGNFTSSTSAAETHTVNRRATTTTITGDNPDPSTVGQPVTVQFSVTAASGTPTGNVTVTDGVDSCTGTVAAGQCSVTLMTLGSRTLTATYPGDSTFAGSTSAGETHTVNLRDPLAELASAIKNASPPLDPRLERNLLNRVHTIQKDLAKGKKAEACAELGKLAKRIQQLKRTHRGLTPAQAANFLKLISDATKSIC